MSYCSHCGAPINNEAASFCPTCGAKLVSPQQPVQPAPVAYTGGYDQNGQANNAGPNNSSYTGDGSYTDGNPGYGADPNGPHFSGTMTRAEMKTLAKKQLTGNWGMAIGVGLVAGIIMAGAAGLTWGIATLILTGVVYFGVDAFFLSVIRGREEVRFSTMFQGFERFGQTCLAGILMSVFILLWSLLLFIPGLIKAYAYSMTYYILRDNPEMKGLDAITASKQMMMGHKWDLFVLDLSFIGWLLLSSLTFGILQICYVGPYMSATMAAFYENLKAQQQQAQAVA